MKTAFSKKPFIILSSFGVIALIWLINLYCVSVPPTEIYRPKLFNADVAGQKENQPFYYTSLMRYQVNANVLNTAGIDENIAEWHSFLKNVSEKTIKDILYDGRDSYAIERFISNEIGEKELLESCNDLVMVKKESPTAFEYMLFAKKAERYLGYNSRKINGYSWLETPKDEKTLAAEDMENLTRIRELFTTAKSRYDAAKEPFLRMRYGYQIVTLARYLPEQEKNCSKLYDKYIAPLKVQSVLRYWAMLHKAHALRGVEADYYYSLVFQNCAAKRNRAYELYNRSNIDSIVMLAKNDKEKAAIWSLASFHQGKSLEGIKKVYQYDATAKNLPLLVSNEVSKLEEWLLVEPFTNFGRDNYDYVLDTAYSPEVLRKEDEKHLKNVQNWVQTVISEKKMDNPAFWNLTNAHLFYIDKQWSKAQDALNIAENSKGINDDIRRQINITRLLSFALDNGKITPSIEQKISKGIIALQRESLPEARNYNYASSDEYYKDNRSALDNILVALANRYEQQSDIVKAGLLLSRSNHLQRNSKKFVHSYGMYDDYFFYFDEFADSKDLKKVLDLVNKEQKNNFENFLTLKVDKEYHRLCDLYGTMLFREGKENEALAAWKEIPNTYWAEGGFEYKTYLNENPFERDFSNPHHTTIGFYTKPYIVGKILELKQLAEKDASQKARYYYLLGNAYYNVSTFGTAWMCSRYGWSHYETMAKETKSHRIDDDNYLRLQNAIAYYKKAGEASNDKRFSAFCYRIAQEADQLRENLEYESSLSDDEYWSDEKQKPDYTSPFATQLRSNFSEFIDNLLNDCGKLQQEENKVRL